MKSKTQKISLFLIAFTFFGIDMRTDSLAQSKAHKIDNLLTEYIPYVTPDGKYFFFTSNKSGDRDIYWVDAKVIEAYKPGEFK